MRTGRANNYAGSSTRDPLRRLAAGVLIASVEDLGSDSPVRSLDSLVFWLDRENGAGLWLQVLGMELTAGLFSKVVEGASHGKFERYSKRGDPRDGTEAAEAIHGFAFGAVADDHPLDCRSSQRKTARNSRKRNGTGPEAGRSKIREMKG